MDWRMSEGGAFSSLTGRVPGLPRLTGDAWIFCISGWVKGNEQTNMGGNC
jgi:hypothetical protein